MVCHGAKFNFAYNARTGTRNYDGLNGTEAVEDLMRDVIKAMKEENLDDETILKTNIGWIYFWSDSFLQCFIKQKKNTVCGSSRSPFALQKMKSQQETTHVS